MRAFKKRGAALSSPAIGLVLATAAALGACSGGEPQKLPPAGTISGGTGGAGGGSTSSAGGGAGAGGTAGTCGDGTVNAFGETCDGADLGGATCESLGFNAGSLACLPSCAFDTSGCSSAEECTDGIDNDKDGQADCLDNECAAACADACADPPALSDPAVAEGDTSGHAAKLNPSCLNINGSGPEVVYKIAAAQAGMLDIKLVSSADLGLSVRKACDDPASELSCVDNASPDGSIRVSVPVAAGEMLFVVVDGFSPADEGPYSISAKSRPIACGDAITDPTEECDDGDTDSGDGCSGACKLEPTETEPNDSSGQADAHVDPFFASIGFAGDVDVVSVAIDAGPSTLTATTYDLGDGACAGDMLDSFLEILGPNGSLVLASDSNGGEGLCARASAVGLAPGTYFVRVSAEEPGGQFPYVLSVMKELCGNGVQGAGEQCDDGGTAPGDGCSPICQLETTETEPNGASAQADPYIEPWVAAISPSGDIDVIAVDVPGPSSLLSAQTIDHGTGACAAGSLDNILEILGTDGSTVLASDDDNGEGYCAFTAAAGLSAGKYFVRVKAGPLDPSATFPYGISITLQ